MFKIEEFSTPYITTIIVPGAAAAASNGLLQFLICCGMTIIFL